MGLRASNATFPIPLSDRNHILATQPAFVDAWRSRGHIAGEHGAILCIAMFNDELCDTKTMPHIELISHIAHSLEAAMTPD